MDIFNFWKENTEKNILKSWLCGGTEGQTYPIHTYIFKIDLKGIRDRNFRYDFCDIEDAFDKVLGFKHDYKLDDADLDSVADSILNGLHELSDDINSHPEKYFNHDVSKKIKDKLGIDRDELVNSLNHLNLYGYPICNSMMDCISNRVVDEVAEDMIETVKGSDWNDDDLRLAFSRVICKHLGLTDF